MTRFAMACAFTVLFAPTLLLAQISQPAPGAPAPNSQAVPVVPAIPQPPDWVARQSVAEQTWVDQVLDYWEGRSNKVKIFECKFKTKCKQFILYI